MSRNLSLPVVFISLFIWSQVPAQSSTLIVRGDSATGAASLRYKNPSVVKRLFLGKNYRTAWATPVTLPLFHLRAMGFTVKELGGGQQTKSLRLQDADGNEWALRTIDKDVEKALPPALRNTLAESVTQDMVSGAQPYAPLVVPPLAQATGVVASNPRFFFVPDDPDLGQYNSLFKNTMCLLEEREPTPDGSHTKNTEAMVKLLLQNDDVQLDAEAVLRARLLDMLIADWDRHQKQWIWGFEKVAGATKAYAIPRDRDQAFFFSRGLLVLLARPIALKHLVGFTDNTKKIKKLNGKGWNFDRFFLNQLDAQDWRRVVQAFTAALPDTVLQAAVRRLPPEIYAHDGETITRKLIGRRDGLAKDALRYYRFLASDVVITGSDAPERFVISRSRDSVTIQQFAGPDFSKKMYERKFVHSETAQVTILGLGGADEFIETPGSRARIRLVLDGGAGADVYQLQNRHRTVVENSDLNAKTYLPVLKKALRILD